MSEIDHIFASKSTRSDPPPQPAAHQVKDKKKKKKRPAPDVDPGPPSSSASKRPAPITVVDSSAQLAQPPPPAKRRKTSKKDKSQASDPALSAKEKDAKDLAQFKDSRGTGDRRRTEEGWMIYKEDELGIGESGGDTPLCPFDCDCCF